MVSASRGLVSPGTSFPSAETHERAITLPLLLAVEGGCGEERIVMRINH
jgi:hypothetical protein